jgi:hypothetical protein
MKVKLHIEELVLEGFDPRDRHRLRDAVEREIARLFAGGRASDFLKQHASIEHVNGETFHVAPASTERQIGARVARSVFRSLPLTQTPGRTGAS